MQNRSSSAGCLGSLLLLVAIGLVVAYVTIIASGVVKWTFGL